jgi:endoglucanase
VSTQRLQVNQLLRKEKERKFFQKEKFSAFVIAGLFSVAAFAQRGIGEIKLNQVGYYPGSSKIAIVTGKTKMRNFCIVSADGKDTVYGGLLNNGKKSAYSSTITHTADFSSFTKPGKYILRVGDKQSFAFEIKNAVYGELGKAALKSFYYQRSFVMPEKRSTGGWKQVAQHSGDAIVIRPSVFTDDRGTIISSPGGWYDKGDFDKCIVNSGITMGTLLSAYEDFSNYFDTLTTIIPESNDKIPDILNEVLYNLRWMFTMQDPFDGGVYHKCTSLDKIKTSKDKLEYTTEKTTAATLDFAAVMAQAGRVFTPMKNQLPGLADSCLRASANAWLWALRHPNIQCDEIVSGKNSRSKFLPDEDEISLDDEWMWAATEMFITSGNKMYFDVMKQNMDDAASLPSANSVRMLAYYSLVRYRKNAAEYVQKMTDLMQERLLKIADDYLLNVPANAFATVMGQSKRDFLSCSNSIAANQAILLINAYLVTHDQKYISGAMTNLDYLLGRNATGYCFVTGHFGDMSPKHPFYKITNNKTSEPVPGLLVAGPGLSKGDKCHYKFTAAETRYVDSDQAYSTNSVSLDWNASFVYLVNAAEALQFRLGFSTKESPESYALSSGGGE